MQTISFLLQKYSNLKPRDSVVREAFNKTFNNIFNNIEVPKIDISNNSIIVHASGSLKSEMLIKKEFFQEEFLKNLGDKIKINRIS